MNRAIYKEMSLQYSQQAKVLECLIASMQKKKNESQRKSEKEILCIKIKQCEEMLSECRENAHTLKTYYEDQDLHESKN